VTIARSSGEIEIALTRSSTAARPILIRRARATSLPADVAVW